MGTLGHKYTRGRKTQEIKNLLGLGFGFGLDKNVLKAYEFIVQNYAEKKVAKSKELERDNIYIFGFSRGTHTARVLAGLIYEIGLIHPEQIHLSGAALSAYKQSKQSVPATDEGNEGNGANFRRVVGTKTASIRFLGVWETVSSVFVPNPKGYWSPVVREKLPHTSVNPAVRTFRHALAIDERRRLFRVDYWEPDQDYKPNIHSTGEPEKQNAEEIWFSGYHSDVGGGYERDDSGLSQFPLIWIINEAKKAGAKISDRMADYVSGQKNGSKNTKYRYPKPKVSASTHNSMNRRWRLLEFIPKRALKMEWKKKRSIFGYYLLLAEPRQISEHATLHEFLLKKDC